MDVVVESMSHTVGAESVQQVNICSFAVRCDRKWPSTKWHRVYTDSGNVSYVHLKSVGAFIPEPVIKLQVAVMKTLIDPVS